MDGSLSLSASLIKIKLSDICAILGCEYMGEDFLVDGFNLSNRKIESQCVISYCESIKYLKYTCQNSKIKALIISPELYHSLSQDDKKRFSIILSQHPEQTFYKLFIQLVSTGIYPKYDWKTETEDVIIESGAVIESGVVFGKNVVIGHNSIIKSGSIIGNNVTIGCCSVIGGDGFQLIKEVDGNMCIPHVGRVFIGDNVSIGDNTTVSKSLFEGFTWIGKSTKIDNHVHIAHNCIIADNCVLTANCVLFGSCELKQNVWIAPHSTIMNRVVVGENSFIGAASFVIKNVKPGSKMFGVPAQNINI